jgi:hypothetical protein
VVYNTQTATVHTLDFRVVNGVLDSTIGTAIGANQNKRPPKGAWFGVFSHLPW